ncbi:DUF6356 family protein [Paraburkholderia phymatum]|uniref:Capsule biosynthesis protein n=1 Tax=Paraburkholderia phymatum (strain DSM 17167 / CIP 108236 / LMG 21445 / STM815) TaxID=391038 RepID=B2JP07_PARP8|nr:DUF6356 family protein [Paraburkholderia phymatum]ACC74560.1 conserved hypothetical protein [Paraburkholderia phymatum STM815]
MNYLLRLFRAHPNSVDETYLQHMRMAFSFGLPMFIASLALVVHALFPFLFVKTGSNVVTSLHERMIAARKRQRASA